MTDRHQDGDRLWPQDERLRDLASDYNEPAEPPREAMWEAIRWRLDAGGRRRRVGGRAWIGFGLALAASLAVGIGLGRLAPEAGDVEAPVATADAAHDWSAAALRLAAAQHLGSVETMLALVSSSTEAEIGEETAAWARDLLTTTRLMLDTPGAREPRLRELLHDLELVLVQLASPSEADPAGDLEFVRETMQQRELLPRVRNVAGSGGAHTAI